MTGKMTEATAKLLLNTFNKVKQHETSAKYLSHTLKGIISSRIDEKRRDHYAVKCYLISIFLARMSNY